MACSQDDANYFETFVDQTCLQQPLTNTALDAQGGLRLATNGVPSITSWDTNTDFNTGVNYQGKLFGPVGLSTLFTSGAGAAAALTLPSTPLPLTPDAADPVLSPTPSTVGDGDNVDDPTVVKVGSTFDMWYTGYAEDGGAPAIFLATSTDGVNWTRANGGKPVLQGTVGAFDENGVFGADVVYDPSDVLAPYKMWYSGRQGAFGGIGYAISTDGITWTKYENSSHVPVPVLDHGIPGSADSFSAADPSVLLDGSTWKMWYTGDDSDKKRIAYATSQDGVTWAKGGKVLAPEDPGASANIAFGAFAPTVWKTSSGFAMLIAGRKITAGVFATKLLESTSSDGLNWSGPSVALNPAGVNTKFDFSNLNSPDVFYDPATKTYSLYYSGNTVDANGNFHTRIGLATSSNGTSFSKVAGPRTGGSVLDVGAAGTAFDSRQASGVSAVVPNGSGPKFVGFYWGTRGSDFMPRLGEATSSDGSTWTKVPVSSPDGGALFGLGNHAAFDNSGERDPSVLYDSGDYDLYFTGLDSGGVQSIGYATTTAVGGGSNQPDNTKWSARSQVLATGFDGSQVSHPSVIKDGATYVMYYTDLAATPSIGRATSATAGGTFTNGGSAVVSAGAAGTFDSAGVKDPVVIKVGAGDYRMLLTGIDADGIERVGYATSSDGSKWSAPTVVLNPSLTPFAADETGVEPTGMWRDGSTLHVWTSGVDRTGRTRGDHATTAFPTASGMVPSGWATYQLGDTSTPVQDWRQIARASNGNVALSMSFLQPYSGGGGSDFWSDYFPVTASSPSQALNFLLTVHGVRWRAQLTTPSSSPSLNTVQITHAPVSFVASGSASSDPIAAPPGRTLSAWGSLVVDTSTFSPSGSGTGSGTVQVLDSNSNQVLASSALNTGGTTTVSLASISATSHRSIRVVLDLASSGGQATPLVHSFTVSYTTQAAPLKLTLLALPMKVVFGKSIRLSGALTQGDLTVAGQSVALAAKPFGSSAFKPLATLTTDTGGVFRTSVKPKRQTVYRASATGVAVAPTVTVKVMQLLKLSAVRRGGKVSLKGSLLPKKRRRVIVIQVKKGKRWKTLARVKTSRRGTFKAVKALAPAKHGYRFRAKTRGYRGLLGATSRTVRLRS